LAPTASPRTKRLDERLIFRQMTLWLPEDEALQYRLAFEAEMERLPLSA
jgi:hypothetical protein